jgi:YidC/Oxa1 family membrane protein insertase
MSDFYFGSLASLRVVTERPVYRIASIASNSVSFVADVNFNGAPVRLTRTFEVSSNYVYNETLNIENRSRVPVQIQDSGKAFTFASTFQFSSRDRVNSQNVSMYRYYDGNKLYNMLKSGFLKSLTGNRPTEEIAPLPVWLAHSDNYFVSVMKPLSPGFSGRIAMTVQEKNYQEAVMALEVETFILNPNEKQVLYRVLLPWPQERRPDEAHRSDIQENFRVEPVIQLVMKPIELLITKGMFLISKVIHNWGVIIMLLALVIKLLLSPLSIKAAISMKRTQLMQPKLKNLQEKYKDDQQTLQQKTVELYRKEGVNPLGGCWPMLVQIPVFFALFRVLSTSVELRGAKFLWIKDLTQPDTLFMMNVPLLPHQFNLLPIVMTVISLVQTYLQQGKNQIAMSGQKQSMLQVYMMPILFLFLFWNMPAGLVLYWTIQNIYSIIEQQIVNIDKKIVLK